MNVQGFDFRDWWSVASEVRHAVVHSRAIVSTARLKGLGEPRTKLLRAHFPGRQLAGGYRLELTRKSAERAIQHHAEYAFHLYKELSRLDGLDPEVFKRDWIKT